MKFLRVRFFLILIFSVVIAGGVFHADAQGVFAQSQNFTRNLTVGDIGADVYALQQILINKGFLEIANPTGRFGALTASAVESWQVSIGLPVTGYFGPLSRAAIAPSLSLAAPLEISTSIPADTTTSTETTTPITATTTYGRNLTIGDSGADVSSLQSLLIAKGFLTIVNPTGRFGALTLAAVAKWQASVALPATGYFGALSRGAIAVPSIATSAAAVAAPVFVTGDGSGGGSGGGGGGSSAQSAPSAQSAAVVAPPPPPAPDSIPPLVAITSPVNNATVSSTISVFATASDPIGSGIVSGLANVEFYLDGVLQASVATSPYTWSWITASSTNGSHALLVKAYDAAGNVGIGSAISVKVDNVAPPPAPPVPPPASSAPPSPLPDTTPPSVPTGLTAVAASSTQIKLTWIAASDPTISGQTMSGVAGYKVFRAGAQIATTTGAAATSYQSAGLIASTSYTYTVASFDVAGNISAQSVSASAKTLAAPAPPPPPPDITPPTVVIASPAASSTVTGKISVVVNAVDNVGVMKVEFYLDGGMKAATTTLPYSFPWDTTALSLGTHAVSAKAYDAAGNIGTAQNVSVTVATPPPPPPPAPPTPNYNFGMALGSSITGLSSAAMNQELDNLVALGVGWIRFDMQWDNVQSQNSSTFSWSDIDRVVAAAAARRIKVLAILDYTPAWAGSSTCVAGNTHCAPANAALFASFAKAAVQRYSPEGGQFGQGVSDWEIWNEPNNAGFWGPKSDCVAYTALLKAAYPAIKTADPNATVLTGGLSPAATDGTNFSPPDFLSCIYANGGKNYFDAVADHPYTFPALPSTNSAGAWGQMSQTAPSLYSIMVANGDGAKKIWLTEFGAPTNGPDAHWFVSEAQQAVMATNAFALAKTYSWAGPLFWYTWKDSGTATSTNENFFGITRADGSQKPAYATLQGLIAQ